MLFYFVTKNVELTLPDKRLTLTAPDAAALDSRQIPLQHIRCGNAIWEVIQTRRIAGETAAVILPPGDTPKALLPPLLQPASAGTGLADQLNAIAQRRPAHRQGLPLRVALINGVGTMLGDTLVGTSALEIACRVLAECGVEKPEVHAIQAWNTRPGTEDIMARCPAVTRTQAHSIPLDQLREFDAHWDFSHLLKMEGYDTRPLIDFYLNQFGIDPAIVNPAAKLPALRLPTGIAAEAKALLDERRAGRKVVLVQGAASTPLRSMPDRFLVALIEKMASETDACLLLTQPLPEGLSAHARARIVHLEEWCRGSTDRYFSLVVSVNAIISVDTVAIHAAMAAGLPGVAIFTTLPPELRLAYAPALTGLLIPDARNLATWGQHKTDDRWPQQQGAYDAAWARMDMASIMARVR